MTMVMHRSKVKKTQTGQHAGFRRGTAAAALGAVLVLTAGVPASHAATEGSVSTAGSLTPSLSFGLDDLFGGLLSPLQQSTPSPTPAPSEEPDPTEPAPTRAPVPTPAPSEEPEPTEPAPTPQPAAPSDPLPSAPQPATGAAPAQPAAGTGNAADESRMPAAPEPSGEAPAGSGAHSEAAVTPPGAAATTPTPGGSAPPSATPRSGSMSMEATSSREPAGPSPLLGWGISLVALSLIAGIVVLRMRRV